MSNVNGLDVLLSKIASVAKVTVVVLGAPAVLEVLWKYALLLVGYLLGTEALEVMITLIESNV